MAVFTIITTTSTARDEISRREEWLLGHIKGHVAVRGVIYADKKHEVLKPGDYDFETKSRPFAEYNRTNRRNQLSAFLRDNAWMEYWFADRGDAAMFKLAFEDL